MFVNTMLRIFEPKAEKVKGDWRYHITTCVICVQDLTLL
jgi:hypothetical protein